MRVHESDTQNKENRLRIAIIVDTFPVISQTFILDQLIGLLESGHDVDIYAFSQGDPPYHKDVIRYNLLERTHFIGRTTSKTLRLKELLFQVFKFTFYRPTILFKAATCSHNWRQIEAGLKMLSHLHRARKDGDYYDIIHCQFGVVGWLVLLLKFILPASYITSFHGGADLYFFGNDGKKTYHRFFEASDMIIANSNFTRNKLIDLGCEKHKIELTPVSIRTDKYPFRTRVVQLGDSITLLTVARLVEIKGLEYSIRAVAKLAKHCPQLKYIIVGEGELRPTLEGLIKRLGMSDKIDLVGEVDREEVARFMDEAHIFLLTSVTTEDEGQEAVGGVIREAMAAGLPVVATNSGGIQESVLDGISGFLVPERDVDAIAEKIQFLINNPDICSKMGGKGNQIVAENFDIKQYNQKMIDIYYQSIHQNKIQCYHGRMLGKRMNILLTWVGPWKDKGEAAMLVSTAKLLEEKFPDANIIASNDGVFDEEDVDQYGKYGINVIPGLFHGLFSKVSKMNQVRSKILRSIGMFGIFAIELTKCEIWLLSHRIKRILHIDTSAGMTCADEYGRADCVIMTGGANVLDFGNALPLTLTVLMYEIMFAVRLRKPTMIWANSFGPFNRKILRPFIARVLNKVQLITTREEISNDIIKEIGVTAPLILTADAAFTLDVVNQEEARQLLTEATGIEFTGGITVGITAIYHDFVPDNLELERTADSYFDALAGGIEYLTSVAGARVIFFPHNNTVSNERDDRLASQRIVEKLHDKTNVYILEGDYSPEQLKGMYKCMDLFIGTRYHSTVFSLGACVPTINIGYMHKALGIMKMLGVEEFTLNINSLTKTALVEKIDEVLKNKEAIQARLECSMETVYKKSVQNLDLAVQYLHLDSVSTDDTL